MQSPSDLKHALMQHKREEHRYHGSRMGPYIHDIVYGANDGIVTTFAVVSGVAGAELSPSVVIILGFANVIADGLSMALGNYLSHRSQQDHYHRVRKEEEREVDEIPEIEREEIREIFRAKGFTGEDLERATQIITSNRRVWVETMVQEEHGLCSGEDGRPFFHALAMFCSFIVFGSVPVLPFLLPSVATYAFPVTIVAAGLALLFVGFLRSWVTRERYFRGPLEIFLVGSICAAVAYGVGMALKGFGA
ncbi:MAG: VIT1/CCC1 transporter family protein [Candidatus Peribacteraceae bacterium]|nr:VIT1/CCC1 transporter family protein [Candidatus Peribacteraceae bacterium]